ncbi:GNAT family N-acetyltransferase [Bacteroides bouchesdurhonensis]|uniref:GNAT family N-acetyltransferase n=1 Tax=Bacteroides bouchesdurhonensis TaxID=1841855 RepID=UPI0011DCEE50|nr:GNAT family N-acetyltransferase [Bacteroides bouchesdurhonensis]
MITIREYQTTDKYALIDLIRLNTPKYFAINEEADLNEYLDTKRELYYVLLFDKKIVGCGGINFADNKTIGKISWDILHPQYQGKSLGTQLLKHRIEILKSISSIQKITVRTSQLAYKFYEKRGFVLNEIKRDFWAKGFDMYYMEYKD